MKPTLTINEQRGLKLWKVNGLLHREDGPAIESADGHKSWWINGKHHRVNGPAVEFANGAHGWWLDDQLVYCGMFLKEFYQESLINGYTVIGLGN